MVSAKPFSKLNSSPASCTDFTNTNSRPASQFPESQRKQSSKRSEALDYFLAQHLICNHQANLFNYLQTYFNIPTFNAATANLPRFDTCNCVPLIHLTTIHSSAFVIPVGISDICQTQSTTKKTCILQISKPANNIFLIEKQ